MGLTASVHIALILMPSGSLLRITRKGVGPNKSTKAASMSLLSTIAILCFALPTTFGTSPPTQITLS